MTSHLVASACRSVTNGSAPSAIGGGRCSLFCGPCSTETRRHVDCIRAGLTAPPRTDAEVLAESTRRTLPRRFCPTEVLQLAIAKMVRVHRAAFAGTSPRTPHRNKRLAYVDEHTFHP